MPRGIVKRFDPERGVGLITQDGEGPDVVAHRSAIQGNGARTLVAGERVTFDTTRDFTGIRADNIRRLPAEF